MHRQSNRVAELIIKKTGHKRLARELRHSMVDLSGKHVLQHILAQIIFAERQAIKLLVTLTIGQV
ncbi:hypothetical protein D3C86_1965100 [compost metagenome]